MSAALGRLAGSHLSPAPLPQIPPSQADHSSRPKDPQRDSAHFLLTKPTIELNSNLPNQKLGHLDQASCPSAPHHRLPHLQKPYNHAPNSGFISAPLLSPFLFQNTCQVLFLNLHALKLAFGESVAGKVLHDKKEGTGETFRSKGDSQRR